MIHSSTQDLLFFMSSQIIETQRHPSTSSIAFSRYLLIAPHQVNLSVDRGEVKTEASPLLTKARQDSCEGGRNFDPTSALCACQSRLPSARSAATTTSFRHGHRVSHTCHKPRHRVSRRTPCETKTCRHRMHSLSRAQEPLRWREPLSNMRPAG